jgi:hypothetical protein
MRSLFSALLAAAALLAGVAPPGASVAPPGASVSPPGAGAPAEGRWFEDVTRRAGLARAHATRVFHNPYANIMAGYTALGAAAAVADFDGDGYEDLFVTDSAEGGRNHLYRNLYGERGVLEFVDVAEAAGVAAGNDAGNATSAALWFDYDNDGRPDLLVVRFGHSQLFKNLGNGRFKDVTRAAGLDRYLNSIAAIAFDYDHDGYLDLLLGNYFQPVNVFHPETPRFFPESFETASNGGGVTLYHNNRDGTFTDVTRKAGLEQSGWTLALGHGDANNDGWDDLYVACDFGTDRFFVNNGDGTFTDRTATAIGFDTKKGMNAEWGDYDNDGWLDVFVTNITDDYMREGNFLWHNNGNLTFTDVARETGTWDTGWGWAGKFFDYDNDGWLDLYVVNGWVSAGPESYVPDIFAMIVKPGIDLADARNWPPMGGKSLSGYQKKKLFHNEGGQLFREEAARHGLDSTRDGRGIAVADFDNDGRLDLFVTNANGEPFLYHNILPTGAHWVEIQLEGRQSNRDAVGTRLLLTSGGLRQLRFVNGGNGFAAQSTRRVHFGLAQQARVDQLEVLWPSGRRQSFSGFAADRLYRLVEGEGLTAGGPPPPGGKSPVGQSRAGQPVGQSPVGQSRAGQPPVAPSPVAPSQVAPQPASPPPAAAVETALEAGEKALAAGDLAAALRMFEQAVAAAPDDVRPASEYRQAIIRAGEHDRAVAFFEKLAAAHPRSANVELNLGYAFVDKIPAAGAITQVILANDALTHFSRSLELERTWIALYTRGNSYLYWPKVFGRAPLAVTDLEEAVAISKRVPAKAYHARAWAALGDACWRTNQPQRARAAWEEGARRFPNDARLKERLARQGDALNAYLDEQLDRTRRIDTDLRELWED